MCHINNFQDSLAHLIFTYFGYFPFFKMYIYIYMRPACHTCMCVCVRPILNRETDFHKILYAPGFHNNLMFQLHTISNDSLAVAQTNQVRGTLMTHNLVILRGCGLDCDLEVNNDGDETCLTSKLPGGQEQLKLLTRSWHVAPFWQGFG